MREFVRHGALVFVGLIAANGLTFVYYATVSRAIGVEAAGLFAALVSAILVASLPSNVGGAVVAKIAAEARGRGDEGVLSGLGWATSLLLIPLVVISGLAATLGAWTLAAFFHTPDIIAIALACAGFAMTVVVAMQRSVLQGAGSFTGFSLSNVIEGIGKAATGVLCWTVGGGLRAALGGYVVATLFSYAFNFRRTIAGSVRPVRPHLPRAAVVQHVFGIALPIAALTAITFADSVLVRHYLDARSSGFYGATALVGRALLTVMQFVPTVLMPKAAAQHVAGRSAKRLLHAASLLTAGVVAVMVVLAALFPATIVTIVAGRAFAGAAPLIGPYALAMGALSGASVLASYLIGIERIGFAFSLAAVAVCEIAAIVLAHPDTATVVRIVVVGHIAALLCCVVDVLASLRRPQGFVSAMTDVA